MPSRFLVLVFLVPSLSWGQPRLDPQGDPLPQDAVSRCGSLRFRHPDQLNAVALSPDGKLVAASSGDWKVRLWEVPSGKLVGQVETATRDPVLLFSPDGKILAVREGDDVSLWDVATRKKLGRIRELDSAGFVAFSADSKSLAIAWRGQGVSIHDVRTGNKQRFFEDKQTSLTPAFSPDGKVLALSRESGLIALLDAATGRQVGILEGHSKGVVALAYSHNGKSLVSVGSDGELRLWDVAGKKKPRWLLIKDVRSYRVAFTPDDRAILADIGDNRIVRLDVTTLEPLVRWQPALDRFVGPVSFSADGKLAALCEINGPHVVRFVDMENGRTVHPTQGHQSWLNDVAFSPDGKLLATCSWIRGDPIIRLWDARSGKLMRELRGHLDGVVSVGFLKEGKTLVSMAAGDDQSVRLWEVATGKQLRELRETPRSMSRLVVSPDGNRIAAVGGYTDRTGRETGDLVVWDTDGSRLFTWSPSQGFVQAFAFTGDSNLLAVSVSDVSLLDARSGRYLRSIQIRDTLPCRLAASPAGWVYLEIAKITGDVLLRELLTGAEIWKLPVPRDANNAMAISPDGRLAALGGADGIVYMFDLHRGKELHRFRGHAFGAVYSLAFSPDGTLLASAGGDTTALVWDVSAARRWLPPPGRLTGQDLTDDWRSLGDEKAERAYSAMCRLAGSPSQTLSLLKSELRPTQFKEDSRVPKLLRDLESDKEEVWGEATESLIKLGEAAVPGLRRALEKDQSRTMERRLRAIVLRLGKRLTPDCLRTARTLNILELIGNREAMDLLRALTKGEAAAYQTQLARETLKRLEQSGMK